MSSSSSAVRTRARVLRGDAGSSTDAAALLALDLAPVGLARIDPARVDAAVEEGRAAGFEAGYAAGRAAALAADEQARAAITATHQARLTALLAAAEDALTDAIGQLASVAAAAAAATAGTAFEVAEAIVGRELMTAANPGRDAVARALALAPDGAEVVLRLHPTDAAALGADDLATRPLVRIVTDASLASGDCVGEARWSQIDARISTALERVRGVLGGSA